MTRGRRILSILEGIVMLVMGMALLIYPEKGIIAVAIVCDRTEKESLAVIEDCKTQVEAMEIPLVILYQTHPFAGGAVQDGMMAARGSHTLMMAPDLETDPHAVKDFIELVEKEKWFIRWAHACNYNQMPEKEKELAVTALLKIPMIVEAQELLERQRIQQGVYLLIPNMLCKEKGTYMIKKELPKLLFRDRRMGKYTIKEKNKKKILHDLDIVGINDGFLFGDSIDKVCAYIKSTQC